MNSIQQTSSRRVEADSPADGAQKSLRSQQLLVAQVAQNGFISRDQGARLGLTSQELWAARQFATVLPGGGHAVCQREVTIDSDETFSVETDRTRGRKVHISTRNSVHVTVVYTKKWENQPRVLQSGSFTGKQNFASGLGHGHYQLTIKNSSKSSVCVYVHVEDEDEAGFGDCSVM